MKQLKQSLLIQRWEKYEFFLHIPHNFIGSNKPFIFYYFKDSNNNKMVRIRKYISKQNGDIKKIKADAKLVVDEIIELLNCNWNSIYNQTDQTKITALSSIGESIEFWPRSRYAARSQLWQITSSTYCRCRVWLRRKLRPAGTNGNHSFVKYGMFDKEQNENHNSKHPFAAGKLFYNQGKDCYICPMGQQMNYIRTSQRKTSTGFVQTV